MQSVLLQDWAIFFPQKAVTLGIGNHERDSAKRSFLHRTAARRDQAHASMDGAIERKISSALLRLYPVQQTSVSQESQSLVATLQKWQNIESLRTTKNMDIVKDVSSLVSW